MKGFMKLCGHDAAGLAAEAQQITVFGDPIMEMSTGQLLILIAHLFRRLRTAERLKGTRIMHGSMHTAEPSPN